MLILLEPGLQLLINPHSRQSYPHQGYHDSLGISEHEYQRVNSSHSKSEKRKLFLVGKTKYESESSYAPKSEVHFSDMFVSVSVSYAARMFMLMSVLPFKIFMSMTVLAFELIFRLFKQESHS